MYCKPVWNTLASTLTNNRNAGPRQRFGPERNISPCEDTQAGHFELADGDCDNHFEWLPGACADAKPAVGIRGSWGRVSDPSKPRCGCRWLEERFSLNASMGKAKMKDTKKDEMKCIPKPPPAAHATQYPRPAFDTHRFFNRRYFRYPLSTFRIQRNTPFKLRSDFASGGISCIVVSQFSHHCSSLSACR